MQRWAWVLGILAIAFSLLIPFYLVPNIIGDSFIHTSIGITYLSTYSNCFEGPCGLIFRVVNQGHPLNVTGVQFSITVANSYFMPVVVSYTGSDSAIFVYNSTVPQPGDAKLGNLLVWKATGAYGSEEDNTRFTGASELAEHVTSVPAGNLNLPNDGLTWNGTDIRATGTVAKPGFYYVYAVAFGKFAPYLLVEITT